MITDLAGGLLITDYESGFMSPKERQALGGNLNLAGSTNGGEGNSLSFAKQFLNHPLLGTRRQNSKTKRRLRCDSIDD